MRSNVSLRLIIYILVSSCGFVCEIENKLDRSFDCGVFEKENEIHERDPYEIKFIKRDEIHSK